jgi:hypothetical protein
MTKISPAPSYRLHIADGLAYVIDENQKPPNWFHRLMVRLWLGWRWEKV